MFPLMEVAKFHNQQFVVITFSYPCDIFFFIEINILCVSQYVWVYFTDEDSPDEEIISEDAKGSEDQAIAQTIVFSLLKRQNYPSCQHHLIPNIVITPTEFRVNMYDAVNDILLSSLSLKIFDPKFESLQIESVIILWMVLHYRIFCAGIKVNELKEEFKKIDIQANFRKIAESKWGIYSKSLKENLSHFPEEKKKNPISYDTYWRAKELTYE